eukprot:gene34300-biopygen24406
MRWLVHSDDAGYDSDDSQDLTDVPDPAEFAEPGATSGIDNVLPGSRQVTSNIETPEEKRTRIDAEKFQKATAETIGESFVEDRQSETNKVPFESKANPRLYTTPRDYHTPGFLKSLDKNKPASVEKAMWYIFCKLLPLNTYWKLLSEQTLRYSEVNKAGTDVNATKAEDKRHESYDAKDKQRQRSNEYNERLYNTVEERAYGKT